MQIQVDAQVKVNADGLAQEIIDRSSADTDHLARFNRIYAGVGLDTAVGSEVTSLLNFHFFHFASCNCFWFIYQNCAET